MHLKDIVISSRVFHIHTHIGTHSACQRDAKHLNLIRPLCTYILMLMIDIAQCTLTHLLVDGGLVHRGLAVRLSWGGGCTFSAAVSDNRWGGVQWYFHVLPHTAYWFQLSSNTFTAISLAHLSLVSASGARPHVWRRIRLTGITHPSSLPSLIVQMGVVREPPV